MTTILLGSLIFAVAMMLLIIQAGKNMNAIKESVEKAYNETHPGPGEWEMSQDVNPNMDMYKFHNGLSARHDKQLKRLYVYKADGMPKETINLSEITIDDFRTILLGIERI